MRIKKLSLVIAICFAFFIQCNSDDNKTFEEKAMTEQERNEILILRDFISKTLGTDLKDILYDSKRNAFIIDKDVVMPIEDAREHFNRANSKNTSKTNQRGYHMLMTPENAASVKIYVYPEVSSEWRIALNKAINAWNTVNSGISIIVVNDLELSNIKIKVADFGNSGTVANAVLPNYKGEPGKEIYINTYYNTGALSKINTMAHELGHTFGFNHTNQSTGPLISCTPLLDVDSFINAGEHDWIGFSAYDTIAISTLYPVAVGTKMLYRYKKNQYYFYTTNPCEIPPGKDGYNFDGDAGYLYATQITGTVPLYRILNGTTVKDHRLNKVKTSNDDIILGYIFTTQQPGTTALYSYGIYESRLGQTPSYMYHYNYSTTDCEVVLKSIVGYVSNKVITKDGQKVPIWL